MDFQGGQCKEMESSRVVTVNFTGNPGGSTSKKIDILDRRGTIYFHFYPRTNFNYYGWLAHLARHAPFNARVKYTAGSSLTSSIDS